MTTKLLKALAPGDVLLDALGRPWLRVTRLERARARGYYVVSGDALLPDGESRTSGPGWLTIRVQEAR